MTMGNRLKVFMYILKCCNGSYYVGSANNLTMCIEQHKHAERADYTKKKLSLNLYILKNVKILKMHFYEKSRFRGGVEKKEKR